MGGVAAPERTEGGADGRGGGVTSFAKEFVTEERGVVAAAAGEGGAATLGGPRLLGVGATDEQNDDCGDRPDRGEGAEGRGGGGALLLAELTELRTEVVVTPRSS